MSKPFSHRQIIRCPLCRDGGSPIHVGNSVMICEACGNHFRVVAATKGKTGARLAGAVSRAVKWA